MNKEEQEFYENANEEEKLKNEIELMSFGNISGASLSTCEAYGISGNCGNKCPKFKDKTCEVYSDVLEKENINLKQALNEIREKLNKKDKEYLLCEGLDDILQIIDKIGGNEE